MLSRCHIVVRETLDWRIASYDQLISPFIRDTARVWDRTFRVGYMACRARIKDIAAAAHRALPNSRLVDAGCPGALDVRSVEPDDVVLMCDDDWYSPNLPAQLATRVPRDQIVIWPDAVFGFWFDATSASSALRSYFKQQAPLVLRLRKREIDTGRFAIRTNNYAVPGALLHRQPGLINQLWGHVGADTYVKREKLPTIRLSQRLSVANRHPCSQLVMTNLLRFAQEHGQDDPGTTLRTLARHYAHANVSLDAAGWAEPFIRQTRAVFEEAVPH